MITNRTKQISKAEIDEGIVLLVDKTIRKTSFDIIRDIRKILGVKKAGHAGTLDPMATGLLIICTGKKTKGISKYQGMNKVYTGTIKLGAATPSMDAETEPISIKELGYLREEDIYEVSSAFIGEIEQIPPMYSAIKHKGKSLYKYARKGIEVEREPRKVYIEKFHIKKIELPYIDFEIICSKGTYIRVIADDLGKKLGCGGHLFSLRRTGIGNFNVEDALTTEQLKNINILEDQPV